MAWKQSKERNRRIKKSSDATHWLIGGAYYDEEKKRFVYDHKSRKKFYKRLANKRVRSNKNGYPSRGGYRKTYDFWWVVY